MTWIDVFASSGRQVARRHELVSAGATSSGLTAAVRGGFLLRVRRDHYALPDTSRPIVEAVRVGGQLACVSALRSLGIFGFDTATHIHLPRAASRLRSPASRSIPLTPHNRAGARMHWWPLLDPSDGTEVRVGLVDALAQAVRCQQPPHAIASLDNALHLGAITEHDIAEIFHHLPPRLQSLKNRVDGRSEAGQETVLRCALLAAGLRVDLQVVFPDVGRVDLVVEGRLVVEADSRSAHDGWDLHVRDRDRDIDLARRGLMSLRPAYNRIMFDTGAVVDAVLSLLAATDGRSVAAVRGP